MNDPLDPRYLPAVPISVLALKPDIALSGELRRITVEQFDRSIQALRDRGDVDSAVHSTRKSLKRLRAVLRLVRPAIGDKIYKPENALLRDTARMLAPIRDGKVLVDTVAALRSHYGAHLAREAFAGVERQLRDRHRIRRAAVLGDERLLPAVVTTLGAARARYSTWPVDGEPNFDPKGRSPIPSGFDSLGSGLEMTYRRGRTEMDRAAAQPNALNFHQWRKRVKYLRHQMEVVEPVWPEVIGGYASSLDRLSEILGGEHDLAVLLGVLIDDPSLTSDPAERALLFAIAQQRRRELQAASLTLGARMYSEPPGRFVTRVEGYWDAWRRETSVTYLVDPVDVPRLRRLTGS